MKMNAVGIDIFKDKSMVAVARPLGEIVSKKICNQQFAFYTKQKTASENNLIAFKE